MICADARRSQEGAILAVVVSVLLSVTFACGLLIAAAHVLNHRFVAPTYDVVANLTAFASAVAASSLLGHWVPATLSGVAIICWLILARRTLLARTDGDGRQGVGKVWSAEERSEDMKATERS